MLLYELPVEEPFKDLLYLTLPCLVTSKREFSQVTRVILRSSKKFSVASHDMKFVFASFLTIISISQSKRGGRRTRRSDSMVANASKWWFLKFHAHWAYPNQLLEIAKVMKNRYFFLFLSLQRAQKVSQYTLPGFKSCQIPRRRSLHNIVAIARMSKRAVNRAGPAAGPPKNLAGRTGPRWNLGGPGRAGITWKKLSSGRTGPSMKNLGPGSGRVEVWEIILNFFDCVFWEENNTKFFLH